jgi:hypothetical protein
MSSENPISVSLYNKLVHPDLRQTREEISAYLDKNEFPQIIDPTVIQLGDALELQIGKENTNDGIRFCFTADLVHLDSTEYKYNCPQEPHLHFIHEYEPNFPKYFFGAVELIGLGILPLNPGADMEHAQFNPYIACYMKKMASDSENAYHDPE